MDAPSYRNLTSMPKLGCFVQCSSWHRGCRMSTIPTSLTMKQRQRVGCQYTAIFPAIGEHLMEAEVTSRSISCLRGPALSLPISLCHQNATLNKKILT